MRYPRYLILLDSFGCLGILSAVVFVYLPKSQRPEEHLDGLWGNLTSELIGIWLSVRLIDWIIRRHESSIKARVRIVRNMRGIESRFHHILDFQRPYDLKMLYRELDWIGSRMNSRKRYLKPDEVEDVDDFYQKVNYMLTLLPGRDKVGSSSEKGGLNITITSHLYGLLSVVEKARIKAENNILEETDEDDGI